MKALIKVQHPFICGIKQLTETQEAFYFVQELLPGDNLHNKVKQYSKLSESITKFYIA